MLLVGKVLLLQRSNLSSSGENGIQIHTGIDSFSPLNFEFPARPGSSLNQEARPFGIRRRSLGTKPPLLLLFLLVMLAFNARSLAVPLLLLPLPFNIVECIAFTKCNLCKSHATSQSFEMQHM